jgi:dTDP-glucose 4,6-dehydratase
MRKRVLLTGVGGFIGSHCLRYFLDHTDWHIVGLDSFRHKGNYSRLDDIHADGSRVTILKHDLTVPIDFALESRIMGRELEGGKVVEPGIDYIISMASDSAVERSVSDPGACWRNNCELVYNMLEFARKVKPAKFFQISTDEIYGDCPPGYSHPEWDTVLPSNPYAASKAAQEALCISYWRSFHVPVVITNCMNCIGITQDKEKFLPKLIWKIATGQEMEIYSDPLPDGTTHIGTRFYLHCENHADALVWLAEREIAKYGGEVRVPDKYNICGEVELNNLEMAELVASIMGKKLKYKLVSSASARPGYDRRYALNGDKIRKLGWKAPVEFEEGLEQIIRWQLDHPWWVV